MGSLAKLATILTLATATITHAQITNPDNLIAPTPRNPAHARATSSNSSQDLQWLWRYTQPAPSGNKQALLADPLFRDLLSDNLKAPQAMWGHGIALSDAARAFLAGPGSVTSTDNRHLAITGSTVDFPSQRGLLYADLGEPNPLIVFAALRWNEQSRSADDPAAPYTLWIFPSRALNPEALPTALQDALGRAFAHGCHAPNITNTLVVDPNGIPHILGALAAGLHPNVCNDTPLTK